MNPEHRIEFMRAVKDGLTPQDAARVSGLPVPTVLNLLEAGENEEQRILSGTRARKTALEAFIFWTEYSKARAEGRRAILQSIKAAGLEDWKAYKFTVEYMDSSNSADDDDEDPALYMGR